ncbi:hypothetical protein ACROYT_G043346 [Oculina patagonica]
MTKLLLVIGAAFLFLNGAAPATLPSTSTPPPDECTYYKVLSGADRAQENSLQNNVTCDQRELVPGWYRFQGGAGDRIPETCVPMKRCGTHAPGWLAGAHPTVAEGVVTRTVCYHWSDNCCKWNNTIRVRNCGAYFVYELQKTPTCQLRYCGNYGAAPSQPPSNFSVTAKTSTSITASWQLPPADSRNGIINGFKLFYKKKDATGSAHTLDINSNSTLTKDVTGLAKYTEYEFQVLAFTSVGDGPNSSVKVARTKEDVPTAAPGNFTLGSSSSLSLDISWNAIHAERQHGKLLGYYVYYKIEGSAIEHNKSVGPNQLTYKLTGLQNANYSVRVAGYNAAGVGKSTASLIKRPMPGDFNECQASDFNECHEKAVCVNTPGSYHCICLDGYFGNGTHCQDFDECQASDLNECHEKAKCTNTLGSYNCTCIDGYNGTGFLCQAPPSIYHVDPPTEAGTEENVTLTCHADGLPEPTYTWITPDGYAVNATASVYEIEILDDDSQNKRGKTLQKDGSLLIFNTRVHDQGIYKCVAINVMGQDKGSVNLTVREDLVEVEAAITIEEEVFDKDLENKSSVRYQAIEKQVEQELTALFKDIEGFERVIILGFYNGSVKVRFRVVVKVKKEDKEPTVIANKVGKTLRVSVKNGQIGSLKVKPTVELRERPPPPVDVQSADVKQTEAVITWSHPELYDMYAISSYLLQIRKFGPNNWTQFTTTRGENHRLTNLDPDTVYFVRLKSENKYGKGEPSENGELRTIKVPEGKTLTLALAIVSVCFLVVLAIVAVFVYRRWRKKGKRRGYQTTDEEVPMHPVTPETIEPVSQIPDTSTIQLPASFSWRDIPRDRITLGKVLGEGEFGMVVKGMLTEDDGQITQCAVKKLKRMYIYFK